MSPSHTARSRQVGVRVATGVEVRAQDLVAVTEHRQVDGERDRAVAGRLGALDEVAADPPVALDVELEPAGAAGRGRCHVLDRSRGHGRHDLHHAGRGGGAGGRALPVGVGHPVERRGRDPERHRHLAPEERRAQVHDLHVDEDARAQPVAGPGRQRVPQRVLVPRSARVVRPRRGMQPLAGRRLEVRQADDAGERQRRIGRRRVAGLERLGHRAQRSRSRARRDAFLSR